MERSAEELIALGKEWLEHAPQSIQPPAVAGWSGRAGFICGRCAGRIMARGCNFKIFEASPVWEATESKCVLCNI